MTRIKKKCVIPDKNKWCLYLLIFLISACNSKSQGTNNQKYINKKEEKMGEIIKLGDISSDIIIPDYQNLELPYSEWETHRSIELLEVNGYENTVTEWRKASGNQNGLIRGSAYYLLANQIDKQDTALFQKGLQDLDETVQTLSAFGLYQLGDQSKLATLSRISKLDIDTHIAATRAAGILGKIGDPNAFSIIQKGLKSKLDYIQIFAIQNAIVFVPLHQTMKDNGERIDIWEYYEEAINNKNSKVRTIAFFQLKELDSQESKKIIKNFKH